MLVLILIVQLLTLSAIAAFAVELRRMRKAPPTPAAPTTALPEQAPAPAGLEVHATMRRNALGEWEHDGQWVREGSEACKRAFDEPGRAVRHPDGRIIEGRQ